MSLLDLLLIVVAGLCVFMFWYYREPKNPKDDLDLDKNKVDRYYKRYKQ